MSQNAGECSAATGHCATRSLSRRPRSPWKRSWWIASSGASCAWRWFGSSPHQRPGLRFFPRPPLHVFEVCPPDVQRATDRGVIFKRGGNREPAQLIEAAVDLTLGHSFDRLGSGVSGIPDRHPVGFCLVDILKTEMVLACTTTTAQKQPAWLQTLAACSRSAAHPAHRCRYLPSGLPSAALGNCKTLTSLRLAEWIHCCHCRQTSRCDRQLRRVSAWVWL